MTVKIEHTSYTAKAGYIWRKRIGSKEISIALQTSLPDEATPRAASMDLKYLEIFAPHLTSHMEHSMRT